MDCEKSIESDEETMKLFNCYEYKIMYDLKSSRIVLIPFIKSANEYAIVDGEVFIRDSGNNKYSGYLGCEMEDYRVVIRELVKLIIKKMIN